MLANRTLLPVIVLHVQQQQPAAEQHLASWTSCGGAERLLASIVLSTLSLVTAVNTLWLRLLHYCHTILRACGLAAVCLFKRVFFHTTVHTACVPQTYSALLMALLLSLLPFCCCPALPTPAPQCARLELAHRLPVLPQVQTATVSVHHRGQAGARDGDALAAGRVASCMPCNCSCT